MKYSKLMLITFFVNGVTALSLVHAQPPGELSQKHQFVEVQKFPDQLVMNSNNNARNATMTIKGPDGFYSQQFMGNSGLSFVAEELNDLKDGIYHYEIMASSDKPKKTDYKEAFNNGRNMEEKPSRSMGYESISQSGYIVIKEGRIVTDDEIEEPTFTGGSE